MDPQSYSPDPPVAPPFDSTGAERSEPPPPPPRRWPGVLAWAVIWMVVVLSVVGSSAPSGRDARADAAAEDGDDPADVQQLLATKAALGARAFADAARPTTRGATQPVAAADEESRKVLAQIDDAARTRQQWLRAAIVAGELVGADAALERIEQLRTNAPTTTPTTTPLATTPSATAPAAAAFDIDDERFWEDAATTRPASPLAEPTSDLDALTVVYTRGPDALDDDVRRRLVDRHEFFGRLALSYGLPDDQPPRTAMLAEAKRTVVFAGLFALLGLLAAVLGLGLLITWLVLLARGTVRLAHAPPGAGSAFVEMFAVYLACFVLMSMVLGALLRGGDDDVAGAARASNLSWNFLLTVAVPAAIAWGLLRGVRWAEVRRGLGWHAGRGLHVEAPLGLAGYAAALPIVVVGFMVSMLLIRLSGATPSHPVQHANVDTPGDAVQLYLLACVWAPLVEETMFRGALLHHLRRRWHWLISAAVSAFIFAAIHPQGWTFIPTLGAIGFALALLREWRGSIVAPVVAHACNNFVILSLLLAIK